MLFFKMLPWSKLLTLRAFSIWQGLEVIEAHYLFGAEYDNIEIVIHPQSIIHSMVETQVLLLTLSCWLLLGDAIDVTCCSLLSLCGSCALEWQDLWVRIGIQFSFLIIIFYLLIFRIHQCWLSWDGQICACQSSILCHGLKEFTALK